VIRRGLDGRNLGKKLRWKADLILAGVDRGINIVDEATFTSVVAFVVLTMLIRPSLPQCSLNRRVRS
jgi:hypothetical protein